MQAAYALIVRAFAAIPGKSLFDAIEDANSSFGIENPNAEVAVEAQNEESLKQLERMMMGV